MTRRLFARLLAAGVLTVGLAHDEVDRGGHFAMWEHPELFAVELRAAFKPLR